MPIYPTQNIVTGNHLTAASVQYPVPTYPRPSGNHLMPYEPPYSPRTWWSTPEPPTPPTRLPSAMLQPRPERLSTPLVDDPFRIVKYKRPTTSRGDSARHSSSDLIGPGQMPVYDAIRIQQAQSSIQTLERWVKLEDGIPQLGQEVEDTQHTQQAQPNPNLSNAEGTQSTQVHRNEAKANNRKRNETARNRKALVEARIDQLLANFGVQLKSSICKEQEVEVDVENFLQGLETI